MLQKQLVALPSGTKVPNHIALVLDGNRRWARSNDLEHWEGHRAGYKAVETVARAAREWGVHTFTAWALSTENWRERPAREAKMIMQLARRALRLIERDAKKEGVRFVHIGRRDRLPKDIIDEIVKLEDKTKYYTKHVFNLALDYGGLDEIVRAVRGIVANRVALQEVNEKLIESYLDTRDQPYPYVDLFIRTSGEQRTSGLMPWQTNYAEFYWERDHLPDFTPDKLKGAILDYSRRRRRFGGSDATEHFSFTPQVAARLELAWWRLSKIPRGTSIPDFAWQYLKEQYGISKELAKRAAKNMLASITHGDAKRWDKAVFYSKRFYRQIKNNVKLAFEPELVAGLEVRLRREIAQGEMGVPQAHETAKELLGEVYRISLFQAAKAAHLRVLAFAEANMARAGMGEEHWGRAEDYLQKYYLALKDRVA